MHASSPPRFQPGGKTSFLRGLLGELPAGGKIRFGPTVKWGYLPQTIHFDHPERTAKAGIEALRSFLISLGMPKNFAGLGAKEEDIEALAHTCCWGSENADGKQHGFMELTEEDVINIYRLML